MIASIIVATDEGVRTVGDHPVPPLDGVPVSALAQRSGSVWVICDETRLKRSVHGGAWEDIGSLPYRGECLLAIGSTVAIAGTAEAHLFRCGDGEAVRVRSFDQVPGRDRWYTPWGGPPDTRSLCRNTAGVLYANVHVGGILRSRDGGQSWTATPLDIDTDVHEVKGHPVRPAMVLAAAASGVLVSADRGETWTTHTDGLHATYCRAVAIAGEVVLASASTGPSGHHSAIYRRRLDGNEPFERCREGLPEWFDENIDTGCLVADDQTVVFGTEDGDLFMSPDAGRRWSLLAGGLPPIRALLLADGPHP